MNEWMTKALFAFALMTAANEAAIAKDPIIAAYYQNDTLSRPATGGRPPFTLANIPEDLISDLYYAFAVFGYIAPSLDKNKAGLAGDFAVRPTLIQDEANFRLIKALKAKGIKVLISIGGWSFNDLKDPQGMGQKTAGLFSRMIATKATRDEFIQSAKTFAKRYGFDGIDIDWEYPGDLSRGGRAEDFDLFPLFLQECRAAFKEENPPLILSYAAPAAVPAGVPNEYRQDKKRYYRWQASLSSHVDRITIMAYDYHGPFNEPPLTGVNAPLDSDGESSLSISDTLKSYLDSGVPKEKILLGLPAYGHSFSGVVGLSKENHGPNKPFKGAGAAGPATRAPGLLSYYEIADLIAKKQLTFSAEPKTKTAMAYDAETLRWVSFDTPETIALKAQKAKELGLMGVIFWSIDMDEYFWPPRFPLIRDLSFRR